MQTNDNPVDPVSAASGLLQPGSNCWRIEHAQRFALLIDAQDYFAAVRAAMVAAKHSIFILGWDIDSRTQLVPGEASDDWPQALGDFLAALTKARPALHVHVLNWDFAMLYALEREWAPAYSSGWHTHKRLSFEMDAHHPVGASHHQKIVVVDDRLAFVGGLDLACCRWDTSAHRCDEPLRRDADGQPYAPFHDVQAMVDGDVARALGELARTRWQCATGVRLSPVMPGEEDPWPPEVTPDITDLHIGIARTQPAYEESSGVYEIRQLYLDAIASSRDTLFFENQYFTSALIAHAIAERLAENDAPEVAVISPEMQSGWLEQATMGVLRARVHQQLKTADAGARYKMYCPRIQELKQGCLNVHSKVFAIDDALFSVGSANMSNRSMATDTECNLVIDARSAENDSEQARIRDAICTMRNRLLAEHLGISCATVADQLARLQSVHALIAKYQGEARWMSEFEPVAMAGADALIPDNAMFDPEQPINPDELVAQLVPKDARKPVPRRLIWLGVVALLLAVVALAWRYTPLGKMVNLASLLAVARSLDELPFTPLAVVAFYAIAGLLIPITLLIAATGIVFGPVYGALYAIIGSTLSAVLTYLIGQKIGRDTVRRYLGVRVNRLSRRIAKRGILAMAIIRVLPVAPFTVVNVIAGASHISLRDYMLGTILGMTPGIVLTVTFVHHLAEAIRHPSMATFVVLAAVAALLIVMAVVLQKLFDRKNAARSK